MKSTNSNFPSGYHVVARYNPRNKLVRLNVAGLVLWIIFGLILLAVTSYTRPTFNFFNLLQEMSSSYLNSLKTGVFLIIIFTAIVGLHEIIHYVFMLILTHKRPHFGFDIKKFIPYVTPGLGIYYPRHLALICMLAPLLTVTILGFPFLLFAGTEVVVPILLFMIATNAGISISDIDQSLWLWSHEKNSLWGFDGHSSELIGRNDQSDAK